MSHFVKVDKYIFEKNPYNSTVHENNNCYFMMSEPTKIIVIPCLSFGNCYLSCYFTFVISSFSPIKSNKTL